MLSIITTSFLSLPSVCLSVCMSVTRRCCVKLEKNESRMMPSSLHGEWWVAQLVGLGLAWHSLDIGSDVRSRSHIKFHCVTAPSPNIMQPSHRRRAAVRLATSDHWWADANTDKVTSQAVWAQPVTNMACLACKHRQGPGHHHYLQCVILAGGVSML